MGCLVDAGQAVDLVTLHQELAHHGQLSAIGGSAYLASLTEGLPRRPSVVEYVRLVERDAHRRRARQGIAAMLARVEDLSERRRPGPRRRH
jgi:replicative DNA helicase